jgi:hypothetical protein
MTIKSNNTVATKEALSVPRLSPPFDIGLVRKSPKVAPKGLVNTKAIQNSRA